MSAPRGINCRDSATESSTVQPPSAQSVPEIPHEQRVAIR